MTDGGSATATVPRIRGQIFTARVDFLRQAFHQLDRTDLVACLATQAGDRGPGLAPDARSDLLHDLALVTAQTVLLLAAPLLSRTARTLDAGVGEKAGGQEPEPAPEAAS